jgi:hypothetical protein
MFAFGQKIYQVMGCRVFFFDYPTPKCQVPHQKRAPVQIKSDGQGLVEFAIILPVLLLLVLGVLYLGNTIRQYNTMTNAADSSAFYASLGHDEMAVLGYASLRLTEGLLNPAEVEMSVSPETYTYGDIVTVTITKTMSINAFVWSAEFPMVSQASEVVQKEVAP